MKRNVTVRFPGKQCIFLLMLTLILITTGCGNSKPDEKNMLKPTEIATLDGQRLSYEDSQKDIEKILGTDSSELLTYYMLEYPDSIQILYRRDADKNLGPAVSFIVESSQFVTYKGIKVGDSWEDVKGRLELTAQNGNFYSILFDGNKMIDPMTEERDDSWIMITYSLDDNGIITCIMMNDVLAGRAIM